MRPFRSRRRFLTVAFLSPLFLLLLLFLALGGGGQEAMTTNTGDTPMTSETVGPSPPEAPEAEETPPRTPGTEETDTTRLRVPLLPSWLRWIWEPGEEETKKPAQVRTAGQEDPREQTAETDPAFELAQATVAALALLIAFLTVAQLWQVPPPSTSLTDPNRTRRAQEAATSESAEGAARAVPAARVAPNLFDSNFSRTVLSGLGGLAVVSMAEKLFDRAGLYAEPYYFILFVAFFLLGLAATAVLRGVGEALRSRITLNRPAVLWPPVPWRFKERMPERYVALQWLRYWGRRFWYWIASFRATVLVFLDTTFNVLVGKNQLQSAVFSETITDLHEGLLEAAERVRDEVHRAVIDALVRKDAPLPGLPHEGSIRVAVSLLSSDESDLYYIAWERGSSPKRFNKRSLAWLAAVRGEARWMKLDPPGTPDEEKAWDPIYRKNPRAIALDNRRNLIPSHPRTELTVEQFFETRGGEDYEGFIVLPMPWTNRGVAGEHRKGAIHISFRKAQHMDALWKGLEVRKGDQSCPNFDAWKGLLERDFDLTPERPALCAVLHQALEVLGAALAHFDDDVYDVYVRARQHPSMAPR